MTQRGASAVANDGSAPDMDRIDKTFPSAQRSARLSDAFQMLGFGGLPGFG